VIELPEQAQPKAVAKAAATVREREADLAFARTGVVDASRAIDDAIIEDRTRYADALDRGEADPGREVEVTARALHAEAQRRVEGEEIRLQRAEVALRETLASNLDAWIGQLTKTTEEAERAALDLVDALRDAEQERARRRLALSWARSFQAKKQLPQLSHAGTAASTLLRNRQASPYDFVPIAELLDHIHGGIKQTSLAAEAARAAEREQQAYRPTLRGWPSHGLATAAAESDAA
jgi:hypothetical protein